MSKKPGEEPDEYLHRLQGVFDDHAGLTRPEPYPAANLTPYEGLLKQQFLNGLQTEVANAVKDSCIGVLDPATTLTEVVRHAKHAHTRLTEKAEADKRGRRM